MEVDSSGSDDKPSGKSDESDDEVRETGNVNHHRGFGEPREKLTMYGGIARRGPKYPAARRTRPHVLAPSDKVVGLQGRLVETWGL